MNPEHISRQLKLSILTEERRKQLHEFALEILGCVGVAITHPGAREMLMAAGCTAGENQTILIPADVIARALTHCPSGFTLYNRDGEPCCDISADSYCLLAALHVVNIVDDETGDRRPITYADACRYAMLMNRLDHLEVVGAWTISDRPSDIADRFSAHAIVSNTAKPFYLAPLSMAGLEDVHRMCAAAAGGREALAARPFWITSATGVPPLSFPDFSIDRLLFAVERGIPVVVAPVEMAGASSPIDLFGTLALLTANNLAGLAVGQLHKPGCPMIMGGVGATMDMRTGLMNYAGPEFNLLCSGLAEMGRHYGLPVWGTGGCTSAKLFDAQAAAEMTASLIFAILSGGQLVHDVAFLDNGLSTSYQALVFCDEIAAFMRHAARGIRAGASPSLLDQIKRAGVKGDYLTSPETLHGFRSLWDSPLMERRRHEAWDDDGRLTLNHRLGRRVKHLLPQAGPAALSQNRQQRMDDILNACKTGGPPT